MSFATETTPSSTLSPSTWPTRLKCGLTNRCDLLIQVKLHCTFKEECTIYFLLSIFFNVFQVILILVSFEELLFRPVVLLDVFAERIIENPDSLTLRDVLSVLKVYSLLNHDLKEKKTE